MNVRSGPVWFRRCDPPTPCRVWIDKAFPAIEGWQRPEGGPWPEPSEFMRDKGLRWDLAQPSPGRIHGWAALWTGVWLAEVEFTLRTADGDAVPLRAWVTHNAVTPATGPMPRRRRRS
ncbi:hypothetical protein P0W64_15075 [Tsukamurella sp. 8F]|uniref:hypothetical protein n=1 Tax=unclassified Tsukamurella TaxID=2633480 RepID=UPI0023B985AB|nr:MULTISPECIES: hypothetical protein [unclassified Tsukamurella]MDF0532530.1 hypothetical protein [Tsukamurella sp. 8J]MDF0588100.1 hypothetical protein [Tsukamurella sp. 8F]